MYVCMYVCMYVFEQTSVSFTTEQLDSIQHISFLQESEKYSQIFLNSQVGGKRCTNRAFEYMLVVSKIFCVRAKYNIMVYKIQ